MNKTILITGAAGELGQALLGHFQQHDGTEIVALDLKPLETLPPESTTFVDASILDDVALADLEARYTFDQIFHLAALLSTSCERSPIKAHEVNVNGTLKLLQLAARQTKRRESPVMFIFPSSIATYGLPSLATKHQDRFVTETEWNLPHTMYGANKLYCEHLGRYFANFDGQLSPHPGPRLDFRALRFPGLISADTLPTGGTSDYAPEMIHTIAQGKSYTCFVREDTTIPFMAMPDAARALRRLADHPREQLCQTVYNVTSFSISAAEIADRALAAFPGSPETKPDITFEPDPPRQAIVDSWPYGLDDSAARRDWGWQPDYDCEQTFDDYLIPRIVQRYREGVGSRE